MVKTFRNVMGKMGEEFLISFSWQLVIKKLHEAGSKLLNSKLFEHFSKSQKKIHKILIVTSCLKITFMNCTQFLKTNGYLLLYLTLLLIGYRLTEK